MADQDIADIIRTIMVLFILIIVIYAFGNALWTLSPAYSIFFVFFAIIIFFIIIARQIEG